MKVLITGGSGFVGRALCERLLAKGHDLIVLTRSPQKAAKVLPEAAQLVASLDEIAAGESIDAIINLAGEGIADRRWSPRRKQLLMDSRVGVTQALAVLVDRLEKKPTVLVNGSAVGFYGDAGSVELSEADPAVKRDFSYLLCDAWENAARDLARRGMRLCILRIGVVLGPGGMLGRLLPVYRLGLGARLGNGRQWLSWIHRADLLTLIIQCLEQPHAQGVYNAVSPQPITYARFHETLAASCRRPALLAAPGFPLKILLGEMSVLLLGGQRVLPARLQSQGFDFRFPDIESALNDLCR
ncbi:MAG: TIGR01777 family protein [Gammaproteobacteria bacterium HGW-Gammaproteobacteria-14]|nr:MAG: TIGR01777 family protein [Gammaproteobacteria bacterium HGW-Gammaproteobacteria-14]